MSSQQHITVSGAPEGFDAQLILAELDKVGVPVCHVARDDKRMAAMRGACGFLRPTCRSSSFRAGIVCPMTACRPTLTFRRSAWRRWRRLVHGMPERFVLLTTLNAATQRVPARAVLREAAFAARVGDRIDEKALRDFLVRMGFVQSPTVMEPGDYAVRGGIIDIYPPGDLGPVRLDLFGDTSGRRAPL